MVVPALQVEYILSSNSTFTREGKNKGRKGGTERRKERENGGRKERKESKARQEKERKKNGKKERKKLNVISQIYNCKSKVQEALKIL
jgi:hypothetical protein